MNKYRDSVAIIADILEVAAGNASKSKIMARANLSYKALTKYLRLSTDNGFLVFDGTTYRLTSHGQEFLIRYKRFNDRFSKVQRSINEINNEHKVLEELCLKAQLKTVPNS